MRFNLNYLLFPALLFWTAENSFAGSGSFTTYEIHEQDSLTQTGPSSFVAGIPNGSPQFSIVASIDTAGASLSSVPMIILPTPNDISGGSVAFPTGANSSPNWNTGNGYNEYHWGDGYTTQAELNFIYGSGNFQFSLGDATAMPTLALDTANPVFPVSPTLLSGGTWSGGDLMVDAFNGATLTFNSSAFTQYSTGFGGQIKFELVDPSTLMPIFTPAVSQNIPGFKNDPPLTSFTIAPGILVAGQSYLFQANYRTYTQINTTSFTGTGITGNPAGLSGYLTSTFITIHAVSYMISITYPANNTIHLQCLGVPNAVNRIESSPDLSPSSFTTLASITADATGAFQYDDTNAGTKKFYRLAYP
jgi:hypothetical protein